MISAKDLIRKLPKEFQDTIINESYLIGLLEGSYNQPWRHYHNLDHIDRMLTDLNIHFSSDKRLDYTLNDMTIAILYHDIVYVPGAPAKQNERQSVQVMDNTARNIFRSRDYEYSAFGIMATAHDRNLDRASSDEKLISDLDMATFALPYYKFEEVNTKVRKELEMVFPEAQVTPGRIKFLKGLLSSEKIFYTNLFSEKQARNNIVTLLEKETKK